MKYKTKIYTVSLILVIALIFGILSNEAKKVPRAQLSTPTNGARNALYRMDTGDTDTHVLDQI